MKSKGCKTHAWVTVVSNEETAMGAIIMVKSLSRVITVADTIALTPPDIHTNLRKLLAEYFDAVIPVTVADKISINGIPQVESLQLYALNFGMYNKCVVLSPNLMFLKNCDELFEEINEREKVSDVIDKSGQVNYEGFLNIVKPNAEAYEALKLLSRNGEFSHLSELVSTYSLNSGDHVSWKSRFSDVYNCEAQKQFEIPLKDFKIVLTGKSQNEHHVKSDIEQSIETIWNSLFNEIKSKQKLGLPSEVVTKISETPEEQYYHDSIAIVGHSCRFPGANNSDEFWELLKTGGDGITQIPIERLLEHQRDDPRFTESRAGFLKCPIDEFDAKFFGISPREAEFMDPQQRLLVEVAWEALENAAINPHSLKGSNTGVFSGVWRHDYEKLVDNNCSGQDFHHVILGNAFSATSARVSYILGLNGPNVATESGCSSSMVGLHLACESLRRGETNLSLVLGANIFFVHTPLLEIPILAKDGHCKTFDEKADGFARAEGVAVLVLKRLSDANKNGDRVMGIVRGSALSNEGTTSSFGTPSKYCQELAVKDALKNSGVLPGEVDYVEAHGTGTPIGDPIEFAAISEGYKGKRDKPLIIGSVKTNTGHTESAAGLAGVIKVLLAMKHETIPPHINLTTLNPNINLDSLPAVIPLEATAWPANPQRVRMAGVSSFGISGTNVHAILEEPPRCLDLPRLNLLSNDRTHHILTISAKSENALNDLSMRYIDFFETNPTSDIRDVSFTANNGRAHLKYRLSVTGKNIEELKLNLINRVYPLRTLSEKPKIAFLFTGMGSQYFGMAKTLFETNVIFRNGFTKVAAVIKEIVDIDVYDVLWNESSTNSILTTINSQMTIYSVQYALAQLWKNIGIVPDVVLGHSLGEMGAFVQAGIVTLKKSIKMLAERCRIFKMLPPGAMLAIRASENQVAQFIDEYLSGDIDSESWLDIAVINSPEQIVVSGTVEKLKSFKAFLTSKGKKSTLIATEKAFHCRSVDPFMHEVIDYGKKIKYSPSNCTYVSSMTGEVMAEADFDEHYWPRHTRNPCRFSKAMETLGDLGCNIFIEIGPNPVLLVFGMSILSPSASSMALWLPSIRQNSDDWKTLLGSCSTLYNNGLDLNWSVLDQGFCRNKLELPMYPFQRQKYWITSKPSLGIRDFGKDLHPMLGRKVTTAGIKETIYQQVWSLKDFPYFRDHQVGNVTVLPGAGYLELILAAAKETVLKSKNTKPNIDVVSIENLVVESPFMLEEEEQYHIQVVVQPMENEPQTMQVAVYRFQKLNGYNDEMGWIKYATAVAKICHTNEVLKNYQGTLPVGAFEDIKTRCPVIQEKDEGYKLAEKRGVFFGEAFKSIETNLYGELESFGEIRIPCLSQVSNTQDYLYHPILLDAMIQIMGGMIGKNNNYLYLPISINKFVSITNTLPSVFYAHALRLEGTTSGDVFLYDEGGKLLAFMEGVRFLKTSVSSFMNVIESQKNILPGMYQILWRTRDGPLQSRLNMKQIPDLSENIRTVLNELMIPHQKNINPYIRKLEEEIIFLIYLEVFMEIGWNPVAGESFTLDEILKQLFIIPQYSQLTYRILEIMTEDQILINSENDIRKWIFVGVMPTLNEMRLEIVDLKSRLNSISVGGVHALTDMALKCKPHLAKVLQGKQSTSEAFVDLNPLEVYKRSDAVSYANIRMANYLGVALKELNSVNGKLTGSIVRILEIGSGTLATTKEILKVLQNNGIPFRYTITDIANISENIKTNFSSVSGIDFKILDIEQSPLSQGISPHFYDIVIASNVLHTTCNFSNAIKNVREMIVPNGLFVLNEFTKCNRAIEFILGISEEFPKTDQDSHSKLQSLDSIQNWNTLLLENYFSDLNVVSDSDKNQEGVMMVARAAEKTEVDDVLKENTIYNYTNKQQSVYIIVCDEGTVYKHLYLKLSSYYETVLLLKNNKTERIGGLDTPTEKDTFSFDFSEKGSDDLKDFMQKLVRNCQISGIVYLASLNDSANLVYEHTLTFFKILAENVQQNIPFQVVTKGVVNTSTSQKTVLPSIAPVWGMVKSLLNEMPQIDGKLLDLDPDQKNSPEIESEEIFFELFCRENCVCLRNRKKFVCRIVTLPKQLAPLSLPHGRYTIDIPISKKIDHVKFCAVTEPILDGEDVEVQVKATGLNFRDIFVILKPDMYFTSFDAIGTDFSGIVSRVGLNISEYKVGDQVFGFSTQSAAASHVIVNSNAIWLKPKTFTFSDAATLPSVFLTAYYCMVVIAKLKRGETILIHVASGGVGLVAIQIAKHIGANVIATAGNPRKRSYLRSIGVANVFHSRDLTFGDEIKKITNGRGVDMVLNSITGPGFKETSLGVCIDGARFVEMGKVNIWDHEQVKEIRPDVKYTIVDVERLEPQEIKVLMNEMKTMLEKQIITPIPHSRFEIVNIRDALNYFMKAEHIGKIVVSMPQVRKSSGVSITNDSMLNSNATYLITGGLGGIGLEVAKWMVDCGAENLVLVGRKAPSEKVVHLLNNLKSKGCRIEWMQVDVGDWTQCKNLFETIQSDKSHLPPLRGIIHSAGALADAVYRNQTWEKYQTVFNAKVSGGWNLHNLTKNLNLEHFVLFSSMVSWMGTVSQSSHAAANSFLDSLAHYRHSIGLPAQTINWGAWASIGAATNTVYGQEGAFGAMPFTPTQGIAALKFIMNRPNLLQVGVAQVDVGVLREWLPKFENTLSELAENDASNKMGAITNNTTRSDVFWAAIESLSLHERANYIKVELEKIVRLTLKLPESESLDAHQPFSELGLDSLMAVEMKNKLQSIVGKNLQLNANALLDYPNIHGLSSYIAEITMSTEVENESKNKNSNNTSTKTQQNELLADISDLIRQDSVLPAEIKSVDGNCSKMPSIRKILLTGSTGHVGSYILRELAKKPKLKIVCLIRAKNVQHATKKLTDNLKKFDHFQEINFSQVEVVVGNIVENNLGIATEDYNSLAEQIDCVIHLAVKANHIEPYRLSKSNADVRSVNVLGTLNILRFASHIKTKRVVYSSSYTVAKQGKDGYVNEDFPADDNNGDGLTMGYSISKFVCEKLIKIAIERGIPCTVVRYSTLVGDSVTGHLTMDTNFLYNIWLLACQMGVILESSLFCLAINVAAKLTTDLIFNDNETVSNVGAFNICQTVPMTSKDFTELVAAFGYNVKVVSSKEFIKELKLWTANNSWFSMYVERFGGDVNSKSETMNVAPLVNALLSKETVRYRFSEKLRELIPNIDERIPKAQDTAKICLQYIIRAGIMKQFAFSTNSDSKT